MSKVYEEGKTFDKVNFTESALPQGDYENCIFTSCNFSNISLTNINFSECSFTGCDLSMVKPQKTGFKDVHFKDCKLLGVNLSDCNKMLLKMTFENCVLNFSLFYKLNLKKTVFKSCIMHDTDFTETDLSGAIFDKCDMQMAKFENSILEGADFRSAFNYGIDPSINRMKKAKFSHDGIVGLLYKYDIEIE